MGAARTFLRLGWAERALVTEAVLFLGAASLAIRLLPFRRIASMAGRGDKARHVAAPDEVRMLQWAIHAATRRAPWRAVCFQQGLAAHWMLRRRGRSSRLHYGARTDAQAQLAAHVWVRSGETDVVGCDNAADYALLATFGD
ncbi:lasso peptide biosynthesis B2 protein [Sphingosinicella sp. LY1275]|uniref:lasso peptide biosynthesis B2 protein n=1 Tax=Sphingosinicella sp. LY1275 TaxID=3095379 RepID=UPI002ADED9B4|nr:lasso peptide biosynthesis B2 protein [Sphingosinicella sp. LY1275]MEA1015640.1 lasso peptide biosynthesis B2 protein [Sphingosinicella sp. LY1275]